MKREFSGVLCNFYIAVLTVLLPLYTGGTYVMLGDRKYALFIRVSLFCLGAGAVAALAGRLMKNAGRLPAVGEKLRCIQKPDLSPADICIALYGAAAVLSALCSSYGATAWTGYREWHMGALSQLVFVGIYFFVSRNFRGSAWPVYLWEAAFFAAVVLGFCSRLGLDPLGLLRGFSENDWEYSHLISTLGNINWFCGYCSVALAMPAAGFLKARNRKKCLLLYIVSVLGLVLLCIQGSDIGPVLAAACLCVCLWAGRSQAAVFGRTALLAAGVAFGLPCFGVLVRLRGEAAWKALPADGPGITVISWGGWWLLGAFCLGAYAVVRRLRRRDRSVIRGLWLGTVIFTGAVLVTAGVLYVRGLPGSEGWESGRGALWRLSLQGFLRGSWKQKLLGAGPDCFAEYIYSVFAPSELPVVREHWAEAVFANAHDQWLNHLVNTGLLGTCCAAGVLLTALRRYKGYLPGVFALVLYSVNSLVSFQQVTSTPLFFLMLGICEYTVRKQQISGKKKVLLLNET